MTLANSSLGTTSLMPDQNEMEATRKWLLENGYPVLPVAPALDPHKYPLRNSKGEIQYEKDGVTPKRKFTGKNPSYLDAFNEPQIIDHKRYQKKLPTEAELRKWFENELNGIGTLGGWNSTIWVDIDVKQFSSQEECDAAFFEILDKHPELKSSFIEQTHSGGYRIAVKVGQKPEFTNFSLEDGGKHVGEALGEGRFTVLSPTIGVSGKNYQNINRGIVVEIESLESIGIYSTKKKSEPQPTRQLDITSAVINCSEIPLEELINDKAKGILMNGDCATGDHSEALATFLNELSGWVRWCRENGINYSGDYRELAHGAGGMLGIDSDRVERIINGIHTDTTVPSCKHLGGDMAAWKRICKLNKGIFDLKCPDSIKSDILEELKEWKKKPSGKGVGTSNLGNDGEKDDVDPYYVSTTVERAILSALFKDGEADWTVLHDSYYQYQDLYGSWKHIKDGYVEHFICDTLMELYTLQKNGDDFERKYKYGTDAQKTSSFKFCKAKLRQPRDFYNAHLLAFLNGTVDLRTGELQEHDKNNLLTSTIASNYVKNAECPEIFRQFVANVFGEEFLPLIRAVTAMYLDPTAPYGYFAHVIGSSGSGKGTLLRFWGSMFGEDNIRSLCSFGDISTAEGRHQYLTGARFISFPDMGGWQGSLKAFYELVDNGSLSGRALFSSSGYEKRWNSRFALASVDYLTIENSGDGWDRRAIPFPTKLRIGEIDPDLGKKLQEVRGEVISWALGMSRADRDNLIMNSAKFNDKIASIKREQSIFSDSVKAFVDMCLRPSESSQDTAENHKLHDWYISFCKIHGFSPMSATKFVSHLKNVLPNNRVARRQFRKDGKVYDTPAHWSHITTVNGAFIKVQHLGDAVWECQKANCTEGGLQAFEEFWNPSQTVTSVTSMIESACDTPVTAETFIQQDFFEPSQASQASQGTLNLFNIAEQTEPQTKERPPSSDCGSDKNVNGDDSACDACDGSSNPDTASVTGASQGDKNDLVTPRDACDGGSGIIVLPNGDVDFTNWNPTKKKTEEQIRIEANLELVREFLKEENYDAIQQLKKDGDIADRAFSKAVFALLTPEEKAKYKKWKAENLKPST